MTTLALVLKKKESEDKKTKCDTFYSHSNAETIIDESDIDHNVFKSVYTPIISNV